MSDPGDEDAMRRTGEIVPFPRRRQKAFGTTAPGSFKVIGTSAFAQRYGSPDRQATGHWCSRCRGIWYGYLLEVTCPVCGNRHG